MIWDDIGFLLSKNRYSENSLIAEVYSKNHGRISGIIFGGTSKKIKNYLQIGNKIFINYNSKSENKIGYFKVEIQQALSPFYFDNNQKLTCISSAMNLIRILTAESEKNENIYSLIENFYIFPNFLIEKNQNPEDIKILLSGLKLVGDYMEKTILKPNNLNTPTSRSQFINTLK